MPEDSPKKEKIPDNFKFKLKTILVEWCLSSTGHGIPNMVRSEHKSVKVMWLIFFSLSFGYCMNLIVNTLMNYFSNPVQTNIKVIVEQPTLFPAITICSLNPFNDVDSATELIFEKIIADNNLTDSYANSPDLYKTTTSKLIKAYISTLPDSEKKKYGVQILSMSFVTQFNGFPVQSSDFDWFYDFDYINCYRFNGKLNSVKNIGRSGFLAGLRMEIYLGNSSQYGSFSNRRGLKIIVHNQTEDKIFPDDDGIEISPGYVNNIKIGRVYYDRLGYPFSDCIDDVSPSYDKKTDIMKIMFEELNQTQYSMSYCLKVCFQKYLIEKCNCADPSIPSFPNFTNCDKKHEILCLESSTLTFYTDPGLYCGDSCPSECSYFIYQTHFSQSQYLTDWYWSYTKNFNSQSKSSSNQQKQQPPNNQNSTNNNNQGNSNSNMQNSNSQSSSVGTSISAISSLSSARDSLISLNVFYDELSYTYVTESPVWNFDSLLSVIGGQLGLFVGLSILSFVEIIEIIIHLFLVSCKYFIVKC